MKANEPRLSRSHARFPGRSVIRQILFVGVFLSTTLPTFAQQFSIEQMLEVTGYGQRRQHVAQGVERTIAGEARVAKMPLYQTFRV
jgi:hypothetical protein